MYCNVLQCITYPLHIPSTAWLMLFSSPFRFVICPKKTSFNPPPARILRPTRRRRNTGHTKSGKQAQHSAAFAGSSGSLKSRTVSSMMPGRAQPKLRREAIVAFSWRSRQQALGWWILGHGIWYWLVVSIPLKNMKVSWDDYPLVI